MDIVLVTALCNHTFRLPQVILDVGVEVNGFGPAIAEDGQGITGSVLMIIFQDRQSINGNVNETSNELQ